MITTHPLFLPKSLVASHGFDLGTGDESPYTKDRLAVAADPARGLIFHLNTGGLYVWSTDGTRLLTLRTSEKAYKPLARFALGGFSPTGELVLMSPEHHLLVRVPVPDDLGELAAVVVDALAGHTRKRNLLKKAHAPVNRHWVHEVDTWQL